jgi:hypothetical protein
MATDPLVTNDWDVVWPNPVLVILCNYSQRARIVRLTDLLVWQAVQDALSLHAMHFGWIPRCTRSIPRNSPSLVLSCVT